MSSESDDNNNNNNNNNNDDDGSDAPTKKAQIVQMKNQAEQVFRKIPSQFKQLKERSQSWLTETQFFKKLTHWAFNVCDGNNTGKINQDELYAGILLVHVALAKYAGAAACYPPSRNVVNKLFQAIDTDQSGQINEEEFGNILRICSVDILSRIAVYYTLLIMLVPKLADAVVRGILNIDDYMGWNATKAQVTIFRYLEKILSWNEVAQRIIALSFMFLLIPIIFALIDQNSTERALKVAALDAGGNDDVDEQDKKKNE